MLLIWNENNVSGGHSEGVIHTSGYDGLDEAGIKSTLGECVEKAIGLLDENINDESLYLMFEWCPLSFFLTIVVTDSSKVKDSKNVVKCAFPKLETENVQFFIRDYFTTCSSFMNCSLVAVFHSDKRSESRLL